MARNWLGSTFRHPHNPCLGRNRSWCPKPKLDKALPPNLRVVQRSDRSLRHLRAGKPSSHIVGRSEIDERRYRESLSTSDMTDERFLYTGLIRLHVLHHAVHEPVYGLAMIEELGRHGYKVSAGTLYPILHGLERKRHLRSTERRDGKSPQRVARLHAAGKPWLRPTRSANCSGRSCKGVRQETVGIRYE